MTDETIFASRSMSLSIENLPDEVLAEILAYLSGSELKSAMLTSPIFADIVAASSVLMKKFFVVISTNRKWDFVTLAGLRRKHQTLVFFDYAVTAKPLDETLLSGLQNIGENLKSIEFNDCCMSSVDLVEILNCTQNVRQLKFVHSKIDGVADGSVSCPQLASLKVKRTEINFEIFSNLKSLTKFGLEVEESKKVDLRSLQLILIKQSKLKHLTLANLKLSNLFDVRESFEFSLRTLKIIQCHFKNKENFEIFLENQNQLTGVELSFSHMKLGNDRVRYFESIVENILRKETLCRLSLSIEDYNFRNFNFLEFNRICSLDLRLSNTNFFSVPYLKYFPNLKSLELEAKDLTAENLEVLNNSSLTHLKVFHLSSECFSKIKIKTLRSLHVRETSITELDWLAFIENNPKISKLVINFSLLIEFDVKLLEIITRKWNLEHIELIDKYLGFENGIYRMIVDNCTNLIYIKLWNINIERDFDEDDKEFLRKRNIQFHLFNDESLNKPMIPF